MKLLLHEIWTEQKPYIGFMRRLGSRVIALKKDEKRRNKFEAKGKESIILYISIL